MNSLKLISNTNRQQNNVKAAFAYAQELIVLKRNKFLANMISPLKWPVEGQISYNEHVTLIKTE